VRGRRLSGFTPIELLVVIAIIAILALESWTLVDTVTNETSMLEFQDPASAQHTCRYYRVAAK